MNTQDTAAISGGDDLIERAGRWLLAKVWLGCLLSGGYAVGNHFGWPQGVRVFTALLAAVALAAVTVWLPVWTKQRPSGVAVVDVGVRALAWAGLIICVIGLLAGSPAVGAVACALLLTTAWRTVADKPVHPAPCPNCGHHPTGDSGVRSGRRRAPGGAAPRPTGAAHPRRIAVSRKGAVRASAGGAVRTSAGGAVRTSAGGAVRTSAGGAGRTSAGGVARTAATSADHPTAAEQRSAAVAAESHRGDGGRSAGPPIRRPSRESVPRRGGGPATPAARSTPPRPSRR